MNNTEMLSEKRSDLLHIDARSINVVDGFNVRQDYGDIEELAQSIKENGIRNPLRGYKEKGEYYLTDGHRRLQAVMLLVATGAEIRVPFITEKNPSEEKRIIDMYICNDGKKLTPLEEAEIVTRLQNLGMTSKEVAAKLGCTEAHICNMRAIADLPTKLKNRIKGNEISSTLVLSIVRGNKAMSIEQITAKVENVLEKAKTTGTKVTKKHVDAEMEKLNSLALLKNIMRTTGATQCAKAELYAFLDALVNNQLTDEDIREALGYTEVTMDDIVPETAE
jgi:ParB/RepB/Spo0J family partition protein